MTVRTNVMYTPNTVESRERGRGPRRMVGLTRLAHFSPMVVFIAHKTTEAQHRESGKASMGFDNARRFTSSYPELD
jgi:hypothetical protein